MSLCRVKYFFIALFFFVATPLFAAPTVTFTNPASSVSVPSGTYVNVTVDASDPTGLQNVTFYLDNSVFKVDTTPPYGASLSTSRYAQATYALRAVATNIGGEKATASVQFTIASSDSAPSTPPPSDAPPPPEPTPSPGGTFVLPTYVYLIDPPPGQKFDIGTIIGVSAIGGGDAGIQKVCFTAQGPSTYNLGCVTTTPYSVGWSTTSVIPGVYTISAVATDNKGANVPSQSRVITLVDPPPTTLLVSPANNAQIPRGSTNPVLLVLQAFDNIGVVSTSFLVDGVAYGPIGSPDANGFYRVPWDVKNVTPGQHIITAIAKDTRGQVPTPSPSVVVTVYDDPPVVEINTPGATVNRSSQPIPVIATAVDDVSLVSVSFSFQSASGGTEQTLGTDFTFPYQVAWNTLPLQPGGFILKAVAVDDRGQTKTAIKTVTLVDARPNVEISTPVEPVLRSVNPTPIIATSDDDINLVSVGFSYLPAGGGARVDLGSDTTAPYQADWSTAGLTPGAFVLQAIATDDVNQTHTDTQTIQLYDTPPNIAFTNPRQGSSVLGGVIPLEVDATDNMPGLRVRFYINDTFVSEDTSAPFSHSWDTTGIEGFYDLRAEAIDDLNQKVNAVSSVNVVRPRITSFNPTGDVVTGAKQIEIALPGNIDVDDVRLLVNGTDAGLSTTEPPFTFTWDTTTYPNSTVTLKAVATKGSIRSESPPVSVTISNISMTFTGNGSSNPQINPGDIVNLVWDASDASTCVAESSPQINTWRPSTVIGVSGTQTLSAIAQNTSLSLRCTTAEGVLASKSVLVSVGAQLPACSTLVIGGRTPSCVTVCGGQDVSHQGTCTNGVCCVPPTNTPGTRPSIENFIATPSNLPTGGGSLTLQWSATGSIDRCELVSSSPSSGVDSDASLAASGSKTFTNVSGNTSLTLTCISSQGLRSNSQNVQIRVAGVPLTSPGGVSCGPMNEGRCIPNANCVSNTASCPMGQNCTIGATGTGSCSGMGETCCVPAVSPGPMQSEALIPCGTGDESSAAEECKFEHLLELAKRVINFLLFVIAVPLAAISFAYAGWLYMTAVGNESRVQQAHSIFLYVVLGLSVALAAWLIVNALLLGLGVTNEEFNFLKAGNR